MSMTKIFNQALKLTGALALLFIAYLGVTSFTQTSVKEQRTKKEELQKSFKEDYNVFALKVPHQIKFAGENVPLDDPDIHERLDRELLVNTYWQSNALLLIKRAHKYFPLIEPILKEEGVPEDFKYLAVAESGLTQVVSPAGATGFWQILSQTGREYGLEINSNVDERYHIEKSTQAACQYLKKAKEKFGTWSLAAASYNRGMSGISRQMERQKTDNYYDLLLNEETRRYVFRILAIKTIMTDPSDYGYHYKKEDLYELIPTKIVEVDTVISDFADFAKNYNLSYKTFKNYNTWLRDTHLNNASRKNYEIKIPLLK